MRTRPILVLLLASLALVACGAETAAPPGDTVTVGALRPGEIPAGEAILNIHWFPRLGSESTARLVLDGVPAVWGASASTAFDPPPVDGSPIEVGRQQPAPAMALPPGTTLVELEVDGVVVAGETLDLTVNKVYAIVAYGELAAPQHLTFVDDIPISPAIPFGDPFPLRLYNLHPAGRALSATLLSDHGGGRTPLFDGLAYGAYWEGIVDHPGGLMLHETGEELGSFGMVVHQATRAYAGDFEPQSGDPRATSDSWWIRAAPGQP